MIAALLLHAAGAIADGYTTKRAVIDSRGVFREGNPVMRWVLARWGETGLWCAMALPFVVLAGTRAPASYHVLFGAAHLAAGAWNWRLIRRRRA